MNGYELFALIIVSGVSVIPVIVVSWLVARVTRRQHETNEVLLRIIAAGSDKPAVATLAHKMEQTAQETVKTDDGTVKRPRMVGAG